MLMVVIMSSFTRPVGMPAYVTAACVRVGIVTGK